MKPPAPAIAAATDVTIRNAHTLADFVHRSDDGPIEALHFVIDKLAALALLREANTDSVHLTAPSGETVQAAPSTPGAQWRADGEPDPHGNRYDCERAELAMGFMSDDELANGAFMNYDDFDIQKLIAQTPGYYPPIAWMTAVKDRIRWLSRSLDAALSPKDQS